MMMDEPWRAAGVWRYLQVSRICALDKEHSVLVQDVCLGNPSGADFGLSIYPYQNGKIALVASMPPAHVHSNGFF